MSEILEIEIKAYCDDADRVAALISKEGGELKVKRVEQDLYFNHPARDFAQTDEALRLRRIDSSCRITYKGPKLSSSSKARVEHETDSGDFDSMKMILLNLGFSESGEVVKNRAIYSLRNMEICVDIVEGLGCFVELEQMGTEIGEVEEELYKTASRLGLSRFERKSYLELKYFS